MKLLLLILINSTFFGNLLSIQSTNNVEQLAPSIQLETISSDLTVIMPRIALKSLTEDISQRNSSLNILRLYNTSTTDELNPGYYYWRDSKWNAIDVPVDFSQNIIINIIEQGDAKFCFIKEDGSDEVICFSEASVEEIKSGADVYDVMGKLIDAQLYLRMQDTETSPVVVVDSEIQDDSSSNWVLIGSFSVVLLGTLVVGYSYLKKKRALSETLAELPVIATEPEPVSGSTETTPVKTNNYYNVDAISSDTEARILASLVKLEQTTFFLNPDITLARMSARMETNTKYLSHVIHSHRGKAIPTYINNLRIKYVVKKLEEDSVFRKYKISHLATLSGFSSHSKFSSEFKRVVGKSPSKFISKLNNIVDP